MSTRPLSAYNVCYQIQQDICDVMNQSPVILSAGIEFIAEDSQSIDYHIQESLKKQGMAAVVMTPSLQYLGHTGSSEVYQIDELVVQFVEYTPINRASNRDVICTGNDLANYTSELLGGPNAIIGFGKLCPKRIEQGEDSGLLVTKLTFQTYIKNGQRPIIYIPYVTREEMEAYVGDGTLTFTKNGEEIGSFSANTKENVEIEIPNGGVWGQIEGDIEDQGDLIEKFAELGDEIADNARNISETNDRVTNLSANLSSTINDVTQIKSKIPNAASTENQLADKDFVNSSINNFAAFYLTKDSAGNAFGTFAELSSATKFYNAGVERTPSKNDYLVVLEDETKTTSLGVNPTTRYTYQGTYPSGQWEFQYIVNNTSLTQAQVNAINSGVTKDIVDNRVIPSTEFSGYAENAVNSQNALFAQMAQSSILADQANSAELASSAGYAAGAGHAQDADNATYAQNAGNATYAQDAGYAAYAQSAGDAATATYAPNYTPLSTFNETLGDLSSIIHGI